MDEFVETFKEEAFGLINELEEDLLKLDENKEDKDLLNQVFRIMHTLKGASAMFEFTTIGRLTHYLENIYEKAYNGIQKINDEIITLSFQIADFAKQLLKEENPDNASIFKKLNYISKN